MHTYEVDTIAVSMHGCAISDGCSCACHTTIFNCINNTVSYSFALAGKEDTFETNQLVDSKLNHHFNEIKINSVSHNLRKFYKNHLIHQFIHDCIYKNITSS